MRLPGALHSLRNVASAESEVSVGSIQTLAHVPYPGNPGAVTIDGDTMWVDSSSANFDRPFYLAMVALLLLALAACWLVLRSKLGLMLLAIREDEDKARGLGIRTTTAKLAVLACATAPRAYGSQHGGDRRARSAR